MLTICLAEIPPLQEIKKAARSRYRSIGRLSLLADTPAIVVDRLAGGDTLAAEGALLIDSFGPRGLSDVCNQSQLVPPEGQAYDAFDGIAYPRSPRAGRRVPSRGILHAALMDQWTRIWQAQATARRRSIGARFSVWRPAALPRSEARPGSLDRLQRRP